MKPIDYLEVEKAANLSRSGVGQLGTAVIFVVAVINYSGTQFAHFEQSHMLIAAAVSDAYMAMNIGANDVANNVGPAVGPLAGVVDGLAEGVGGGKVTIPLWVATMPVSAVMAAPFYFTLCGKMLP